MKKGKMGKILGIGLALVLIVEVLGRRCEVIRMNCLERRLPLVVFLILAIAVAVTALPVQAADMGELHSAETRAGNIAYEGQTDSFFFYGEAGQGIVIEMAANASDLGPAVYLYRPDETLETQVVGGGNDNRVAIREHQLEQTGTYTIVSSASWAYGTSKTGEYCLSLVLIPGATSSVQDPDGGTIASGETACGTIDPNGDTDAFTFYGQAGQGVVIEMAANASSDLGPAVYLYRPDGTLETQVVGGGNDNRVAIGEHQLEQTGTYTIVSSASWAYGTSKTGEYCLSLVLIPGTTSVVDISVVLQGGSRPPEAWEVPITIKFFGPGADVIFDSPICVFNLTTTKSDSTAVCQCTVAPGTYDITAVSEHTLINVKRDVVISTPSTAVDMGTLLEGNANDDIIINISDFGILAVSYMKIDGEPGYDARADFDRNGIINISDFSLLAVNYMEMSPIDVS
jgi:hypothetical protein